MLALYQPLAALEQIRGVVRHFAALFEKIAALVESIAAHVAHRFAPLPGLLVEISPGILARLRSVQQCHRCAHRRTRQKPYEAVCLLHIFILPIPGRTMLRAILRA
jgi:hypothetical protein